MKLGLGAIGTVTIPGSHLRWESHMCAGYSVVGAHASCSDSSLIVILFSATPPGGATSFPCLSETLPVAP